MIKPTFLHPDDQPVTVGRIFGSPLVVMGITWIPLLELAAWGILSWQTRRSKPEWSLKRSIAAGGLVSIIMFASEWCHNLAHAAVARLVRQPVEAIRIFWGTPLLIYYDINDRKVSPAQHRARALGGPIFNTLMIPLCWLVRHLSGENSLAYYAADFGVKINRIIASLSLTPLPFLDGGPIIKWSLVEKGYGIEKADEMVKYANLAFGGGLGIASCKAFKKRKHWAGAGLAALAITSVAIGIGLLKDHE